MVARIVAERAGVERLGTDLVLEGGGIEVDGEGTAIVTERCVLNKNRNPGWTKLNIDWIAAGGGGIHCTTQQEPR